eukprot:31586-Rhodomonas_salina.1
MSALATSLRSVLAVMPSQKMLRQPLTTGMEAVRVVFICHGASPSLGLVGASVLPACAPFASRSMAETTKSTKMLFERVEDASGKKSTPSGMLKDAKWSGTEAGLRHIDATGAHS